MARYNKHENTNYSIFTAFAGDRAQWIVTGSEDNKVRYNNVGVTLCIEDDLDQMILLQTFFICCI